MSTGIFGSESLSDWDPDDPEPRPPVVKKDIFVLREDKFTVLGHEREEASRIRDLMHPEELEGTDREEVQTAIKGMNRRRYFHALLIHYGIYKRKNMVITDDYSLVNTILPLMQEALDKDWFDKVPRSILKLERKLRKEMEDDTPKYLRNRAKWERYMAQKRSKTRRRSGQEESDEDTAWRKLDDYPGQRANLDMDRFFNHYFLTDGMLGISKTPNPLRLDNITVENGKEVIRRTKALKGLHFCHTPQTAGSVLCVGVDQASVRDLTYKIRDEARAAAERNFIRHQEELWKEDMQAHNILAGQLCQQKAEDFADSEPMWKLRDCSGLFILRSEQIRAQYPRHLRNTLRISAKLVRKNKGLALVARFDFGVCSGTMFLAESIQTLQGLAEGDSHDMDAESDGETSANDEGKRIPVLNRAGVESSIVDAETHSPARFVH